MLPGGLGAVLYRPRGACAAMAQAMAALENWVFADLQSSQQL
jgi:hypothetical protein